LYESLIAEVSSSPSARGGLAHVLRRRGQVRRALGDREGASVDARRALTLYEGLPERSGQDWFGIACCLSALVSSGDGPEDAADRALDRLRRAVAGGYRDSGALQAESSLDPLRHRREFALLLMDLAVPGDPFAKNP
jgi:hypothetical protein